MSKVAHSLIKYYALAKTMVAQQEAIGRSILSMLIGDLERCGVQVVLRKARHMHKNIYDFFSAGHGDMRLIGVHDLIRVPPGLRDNYIIHMVLDVSAHTGGSIPTDSSICKVYYRNLSLPVLKKKQQTGVGYSQQYVISEENSYGQDPRNYFSVEAFAEDYKSRWEQFKNYQSQYQYKKKHLEIKIKNLNKSNKSFIARPNK
jgi:hypothetical protein